MPESIVDNMRDELEELTSELVDKLITQQSKSFSLTDNFRTIFLMDLDLNLIHILLNLTASLQNGQIKQKERIHIHKSEM